VPDNQGQAALCTGAKKVAARLINVSATGFLVACQGLEAREGDLFQLVTGLERTEVRVVFFELHEGESRLGLERVREILNDSDLPRTSWLHSLIPFYETNAGGIGGLVAGGGLLVGLVILCALCLADSRSSNGNFLKVPAVSKYATRVADNVRQALSSVAQAPASSPTARPLPASSRLAFSPVQSSRPPSQVTATTARLFAERWQQGDAAKIFARLNLSAAQVRHLDQLLANQRTAGAINNRELSEIELQLTEILTAEQLQAMQTATEANDLTNRRQATPNP
jgi:hypothetical protein